MTHEEQSRRAARDAAAGRAAGPRGRGRLRYILESAASLVTGLRITAGYFFNPRAIVTQQYPDNRAELRFPPRFRGRVVMPHDAAGEHKCTACGMCEKACPNGSISILATRNVAGKRVLGRFVYRLGQCMFCNLCVEACPFGAIEMGSEYEMATVDRAELVQTLNRKEGR